MSRRIVQIIAEVAARHDLRPEEITGPERWKRNCRARYEAMWLARQAVGRDGKPLYSLPQIGRFFNRDHTTVLNALRRHEEQSGIIKPVALWARENTTGTSQVSVRLANDPNSTTLQITA